MFDYYVCPKCGKVVKGKFCWNCGNDNSDKVIEKVETPKVTLEKRKCHKCGLALGESYTYCNNCGEKITELLME